MKTEDVDPLLQENWFRAEEARLDQELRASIYELVDHRIAKGEWRQQDREEHFQKMWKSAQRIITAEVKRRLRDADHALLVHPIRRGARR